MGMDIQTYDFIVRNLRQAQKAVQLASREAPLQKGYKGFDLALAAITGTQEAFGDTWQATRDPLTAIEFMTEGIEALGLCNAGAAGPSIKIAIGHMQSIIDELDPPAAV
jgi:hypothetical protein